MTALASGLLAARDGAAPLMRPSASSGVRVLVFLALFVTLAQLPTAFQRDHAPQTSDVVARWIRASAHATDTITVVFTHANLVQASGLAPAYPYSWSLPIRTLDPHLNLLVSTLGGRDAPTWFVRWDPPHLWNMDPHNRVAAALESHYVEVADFRGRTVWLHDADPRTLAPLRPRQAVAARPVRMTKVAS
jgi:hypothetical protein